MLKKIHLIELVRHEFFLIFEKTKLINLFMSVTTSGVKGYEYQYALTVFIALKANFDTDEVWVEKVGGEDVQLNINKNGNKRIFEIQVKRENNPLDIALLVKWLVHFQERSNDNNLLSRITNNSDSVALFVTRSRCTDSTVMLRQYFGKYDIHSEITNVDKNWKNEFIQNLKTVSDEKTDLGKERATFCIEQSTNHKILVLKHLKNVLIRVLIWEETTEKKNRYHYPSTTQYTLPNCYF